MDGHDSSFLAAWNEGATKNAIVDFVRRVTLEGSQDYVAPEARVAVFDNDGTLWCEKPMPVELDFILRRLASMAEKDEALRTRQPWQAAYNKDYKWLGEVITKHYQGDDTDVKVLLGGILKAFEGMSVDEYMASAADFFREAENPVLKRSYISCSYLPMVQLLQYLEAHGFTNYIASGGDRDFMRVVTQDLYGIPSERVVGSSNALRYVADEQGGSVMYQAAPDIFDDGPVKPVRIWTRIGRRPILVGGNSNGDIEMLQFAAHPSRPSLSMLVNHDDNEREIAYTAGAEKLLDAAAGKGWTVISVKNDWNELFRQSD